MSLSTAEQARRAELLQTILADLDLDVLVLAGADYRGHKGTLRWVGDYNLAHRYGFAIAVPGRAPFLLLPTNLEMGRRGGWKIRIRFERDLRTGLPATLRSLGKLRRIGLVGAAQAMKVEDYLALTAAFPEAELVDAQEAFERVRARKSPEELEGARESTRIAEACLERLYEIVRPGMSERDIAAAMYERTYALGGEDPLFLIMDAQKRRQRVVGGFGAAGDKAFRRGDYFTFSFELVGRLGYWMELARTVSFGEPAEPVARMATAVQAGLAAAARQLKPAKRPDQVQRAIVDAVAKHGGRSAYWSGHGIGQDVIEEPWLGLEVVQDRDAASTWVLEENMVISIHPYAEDVDGKAVGYMANTYIVTPKGGESISKLPLDIHVVS